MGDAPERIPRLYTIDPSRRFLTVLVDALVTGHLIPGFAPFDDPLRLSTATILLPTRRAARALKEVFLARFDGRPVLLPAIRPIGDVDGDGFDAIDEAGGPTGFEATLSTTERLIAMTRLVLGWRTGIAQAVINPVTGRPPTIPESPADAVHLATSLLQLMDQMASEGADWSRIPQLVPQDHAAHWELTLAFLKLVVEAWPAYLGSSGRQDPAASRDARVRAEAARLAANPPAGPVIAAGSTGSIPSTAALLDVIARLPQGAVVLPGLDRHLDEASWEAIGGPDPDSLPPVPGHPQYGLKLLLQRLRATRSMVEVLEPEDRPALADRLELIAEAMRPAPTTDRWREIAVNDRGTQRQAALADVSIIAARSEPEEALAVSVALREALETPGRTAALVTPDRLMARRVATELRRWGLAIDDSAGVALSLTPAAVFARLVAEVAIDGFDPVKLVALMQHPLAAFGLAPAEARRFARVLEIGALRGPRPRRGSAGLIAAIVQAEDDASDRNVRPPAARRRIPPADWARAHQLAEWIARALAPLEALADRGGSIDLAELLEAHVAAIEAASAGPAGSRSAGGVFEGPAGETLATGFADLLAAARQPGLGINLAPRDYPGFLKAVLGDAPVRQVAGQEARLHIWGPLEARLQSVDLLILGGLNEGNWPNTTRSDPWLSRPMRAEMGLEPPERRIGLAAHDVAQGFAAPEVIIARSAKSGTAPTVASRWLQRLTTVAGAEASTAMTARGERHLGLARLIDHRGPAKPEPVARPMPRPPVEARPKKLSVTAIETWIRDPYALYARIVLRLEALEPIGAAPDASDRGNLVHDVLAEFVHLRKNQFDAGALAQLLQLGEFRLEEFAAFPEVTALWRPRLAKIARWFLDFEIARSARVAERSAEIRGELEIPVMGEVFTLIARADRIDRMADGSVVILDYKTGQPPTARQVESLMSPQLPLEAAMLARGAFGDRFTQRALADLAYVHLAGTRDGGAYLSVAVEPAKSADAPTPESLAEAAYERLVRLIGQYRNPETPYPSRPRIMFEAAIGGDYDHLARVKEWAAGEGGEE